MVASHRSPGYHPRMTELVTPPRVIDPAAPVYNARLVRREEKTDSLAYFWVKFDGEPTPFEAGQYMTIGVMVDGKIVQRPYSVASPPAVIGTEGYEFYVRLVEGGTFTPLLWDLPIGHGMRMIGPKGKFMLRARRRADAHLHLVGDRQCAVRGDDAPAPDRRPAAARSSSSTACRTRRSLATGTSSRAGSRAASIRSRTSRRSRARTIHAMPTGPAGPGRVESILGGGPRRARADARRTRSPTSAATRT